MSRKKWNEELRVQHLFTTEHSTVRIARWSESESQPTICFSGKQRANENAELVELETGLCAKQVGEVK